MTIVQHELFAGKQCRTCGEWKQLVEYHRNHRMGDGHSNQCKACRKLYAESIAEVARERTRQWRKDHPERVRAHNLKAQRSIRERRPDYMRQLAHKSYMKHREARIVARKRWAVSNKERVRQYAKVGYKRNSEQIRATQRKYHALHPEYSAATSLRYIARKRGATGSYTVAEWLALCEKYNHKCLCCGVQEKLHADHIIPLSCGGSNTIDNIQPLCKSCNSKKRAQTIDYRT